MKNLDLIDPASACHNSIGYTFAIFFILYWKVAV